MTPPPNKWLFFPTPSGGDSFVITGTASADLSASSSSAVTSWAKSGTDADDFLEYPHTPVRVATSYVEILFKVDTGQSYANVGAFESATTMVSGTSSYKIGGNTFPHTSVTHTHGSNSGSVVRVRFNAASSAVTTFRNLLDAGDAVEITMNWTT